MPEAEVEPDGRVERANLVHEKVRQLGFERVGVRLRGEVPAEVVTGGADGVGEAMHDLADARLPDILVAVDARLAEVLRDDDVRGELTPVRRDLRPFHLEDDRSVRVRDDARAALVDDLVERIRTRLREAAFDARAARCARLRRLLRRRRLRRRLNGRGLRLVAAFLFVCGLHAILHFAELTRSELDRLCHICLHSHHSSNDAHMAQP